MIAKVCDRGQDPAGLVYYLFRESPAHERPRFIAGFDEPDRLGRPTAAVAGAVLDGEDSRPDLAEVIRQLQQPVKAARMGPSDLPVYHLVLATKQNTDDGEPSDRILTDAEYRRVAEDALTSVGLINDAKGKADVRWVAVRHDDHHVHVVVTMAREDGTRAYVGNDYWKLGRVAREAEKRLGLIRTGQRDSTAVKRPTRAENEIAARNGWSEPTRVKLRREVQVAAASANDLDGFFEQLRSAGLMVKTRYSTTNVGQLTGYTVADPTRLDGNQQPIFFSGGRLAADLTLPKLRLRFEAKSTDGGAGEGTAASSGRARQAPVDREQLWQQAVAAAGAAAEEIREFASSDPTRAADAAWAAADFLRATSRMVEGRRGGALSDAAEHYDRAAREAWARPPAPSRAGSGLRQAASLMLAAQLLRGNETKQLLLLLAQLAVLSDAVVRLREEQDRGAQAAAARTAAEALRDEYRARSEALQRLTADKSPRSTSNRTNANGREQDDANRSSRAARNAGAPVRPGAPGHPVTPPRSR